MAFRFTLAFLLAVLLSSATAYPRKERTIPERFYTSRDSASQHQGAPSSDLFIQRPVDKRGLSSPASSSSDSSWGYPCTDVIVIFARGTNEDAPIGKLVGPQLNSSLATLLASDNKSLTFAGLTQDEFPADYAGFFEGGSPNGSAAMALKLTNAANSCPTASIVSAGYSQGAQLVHKSAEKLTSTAAAHIKAAVTFGDPDNGHPIQGVPSSATKIICHSDDVVCDDNELLTILFISLFLENHLDYYLNVDAAAQFIAARV
ncbi:cutinase-domain-containing protein [Mycena galopus ATCC 62051]|nr:cutinase-domain-containing protein [Mycena galopus ATCC 62051]